MKNNMKQLAFSLTLTSDDLPPLKEDLVSPSCYLKLPFLSRSHNGWWSSSGQQHLPESSAATAGVQYHCACLDCKMLPLVPYHTLGSKWGDETCRSIWTLEIPLSLPTTPAQTLAVIREIIPWWRKKCALPSYTRQASTLVEYALLVQLGVYRSFYSLSWSLYCLHVACYFAPLLGSNGHLVWCELLLSSILHYHQSEQEQPFGSNPLLLTNFPSQGKTLWNKHTLILPRRECSVTPHWLFHKGYSVPELFLAEETSPPICGH